MSNKVIKSKTRKPNLKDKVKGSMNWIGFIIESLFKGDINNCKFGYVLLKQTIKGDFEIVVREK